MEWDNITDRFGAVGDKVGRGLKRMFGSENERFLRTLEPIVGQVADLEEWAQGLDRDAMQAEMRQRRESVGGGETELDDHLPHVFAMVREASMRTLGMRHFDVQIVGGFVLHEGKIAEMSTGEGKTIVATLPMALNALIGRTCFLVTVNDYLAGRDANWMRPIYEYLGLSVGSIQSDMDPTERRAMYDCDIVYGTNNEFGFDYLRDNMKTQVDQQVQRDLYFAIVDEVDSILIDEARTPLIISGPAEEHIGRYVEADKIAVQLERDTHYEVKEKERSASMTEAGIVCAQELLGVSSFYEPGFEDWPHYLENAIRAHTLYNLDKEYVVEEAEDPRTGQVAPEVIIVDEFTGRKMQGRRWSDGLHQAVEVKEGLIPKQETQTLATITFQNYFRMYDKLSGMTGTALTEAGEFHKIYGLDVVSIPTHLPIARDDDEDVVYRTEREKWNAICDEIEEVNALGQPILVGTASVDNSETLSAMLRKRKLKHEVLNAKNHEREAQIIALAGDKSAVTVATNMAGRGTDIKLGGNLEYRLARALEAKELVLGDLDHLEEIDAIREQVRERCDADEQVVLALGGLYVLGTERHESRRIDNQLRGRSGRQGNAGRSRFFLSLEDPLMRIFYRDWVVNAMERLGMTEGQPIESGMVTRAIAKAQRKVEDRNFEIRKSLLEYDEVMDQQRKTIYGVRQDVMENIELTEKALTMLGGSLNRGATVHLGDPSGFKEWCLKTFGLELDQALAIKATEPDEADPGPVLEVLEARHQTREKELGEELTRRVEQYLILNAIDGRWKDHLKAVDALKAGIGLRGYGQEDPKTAYKREGTTMFQEQLLPAIEDEVASLLLRIEVRRPDESDQGSAPGTAQGDALQPRGMVQGGQVGSGAQKLSPQQLQELQRRARAQVAQQSMRGRVPASGAFDMMRRQKAAKEQQQVAGDPGSPGNQPPQPGQKPLAAPAEAFPGTGRNDPCPCGSGKKFKKCHGS
ncbi:MAG: preprotein translocase subunit SecA [bacterium]